MRMFSFDVAEMADDDRDYDSWLTTLTQASERLDVLETAIAELCRACRSQDVNSQQVLDVLKKHGAITAAAAARSVAA